jgi:exodeoxyribonuclease V alpha subunit
MGERTRNIEGIVAPRTLHRLLEYSVTRRRFGRDRFNPLRQDGVLVDEASMIDLHMMRSILDALGGATLVLIGDAEQLPSVESGTVLRDLKPQSGELGPRFIRLTQSFRQADDSGGAEILLQARLVRDGSTEGWARMDLAEQWEAQPGVSRLEIQDKANLEKMISRWVRTRLIGEAVLREAVGHTFEIREGGFDEFDRQLLEGLFAFTKRERFLCVTKRRATGSIALNEAILSRMEDEFGFKGLGPGVASSTATKAWSSEPESIEKRS